MTEHEDDDALEPFLGSRILQTAINSCWAMEPSAYNRMLEVLERHARGVRLSQDEIRAATSNGRRRRKDPGFQLQNGVAVIPIHGVISKRASMVEDMSEGAATSVDTIRRGLRAAMSDPAVGSILFDVDSPGGAVDGIDDLATEIRDAREKKPILAIADGLMASAAYYLASQADRVFATRSSEVGSIGVIASFVDTSRALKNRGFDPKVIKSVPGKGSMQSDGATGDPDLRDIQEAVNGFHELFVESVAEGRGISMEQASEMGDGRIHLGTKAKDLGFIDAVVSFTTVMGEARELASESLGEDAAAAPAASTSTSHGGAFKVLEHTWHFGQEHESNLSCSTGERGAVSSKESNMTQDREEALRRAAEDRVKGLTAEDLRRLHPGLADALEKEGTDKGAQHERKRCTQILRAAGSNQQKLVLELVESGAETDVALVKVCEDLKGRADANVTKFLQSGDEPLAGGNADDKPKDRAAEISAMPDGEEKWKAEFEANVDGVRSEFGSGEKGQRLYLAFKRGQERKARLA